MIPLAGDLIIHVTCRVIEKSKDISRVVPGLKWGGQIQRLGKFPSVGVCVWDPQIKHSVKTAFDFLLPFFSQNTLYLFSRAENTSNQAYPFILLKGQIPVKRDHCGFGETGSFKAFSELWKIASLGFHCWPSKQSALKNRDFGRHPSSWMYYLSFLSWLTIIQQY